MTERHKLSISDREFFAKVEQAVTANPFSAERIEADRAIADSADGLTRNELLDAALAAVNRRLGRLRKKGAADSHTYQGEDRYLLRTAALFSIFHRYMEPFDQLANRQVAAGSDSMVVPFAHDALNDMRTYGIEGPEALHMFAKFYQIRRAFYFIHFAAYGKSPCMQELRGRLWTNIFTHDLRWYDRAMWNRMEDFSTLLLGETGTGKGITAMAIGRSCFIPFDEKANQFAHSFMDTFISINLSQYPETLIESELFGHRKGAFTGAVDHHEGLFSRCSPNGAVFLDEIGELTIPVQIKLLQVIQERRFSPVGSHEPKRFEGRIIAATNRPMAELRAESRFRDDLYYRLCSDEITIPPLRTRIRENTTALDELTGHILARFCGEEGLELHPMVVSAIEQGVGRDYDWPGNVRELEQAVRRILLTGSYDGSSRPAAHDAVSQFAEQVKQGELSADALLSGYCRMLYDRLGTYENVARRTGLDWRTVKKYVTAAQK